MSEEIKKTEGDLKKNSWSAKRIAIIAIFIALSAVGAVIKIPSPLGSIGLDSFPGYFCAFAFGYPEGAIVIAIGHILSAAVAGFSLTVPLHLAIAVSMAIVACIVRFIAVKCGKIGIVLAAIVGTVLNSFVLGFWLLPLGGWGLYVGATPSLFVASLVNAVIAAVAYYALRNTKLINK